MVEYSTDTGRRGALPAPPRDIGYLQLREYGLCNDLFSTYSQIPYYTTLPLLTNEPIAMAIFYESIPKSLIEWILAQKVFWVATAPLSGNGHVNVSPKGGEYFGVIDERTFWYQELSGSGIETVSHLHEPRNGRITVMFNAFEGGPKIIRLWGKGEKPLFNFQFAQGMWTGESYGGILY